MKNRIIAVAAALAVLCPSAVFAAEAEQDRVEIDFAVGDSVLMVNGESLEVTAPYVVGDGTTLVPVRVITEAFGAEVGWDGATQTVTLDYPDVSITLTIGSDTAMVNDHTEKLAAAPELYNDTTMVPLRFISETFDAVVTYDDATRRITVVKESKEEQSQIEAGTDKPYIGDSFYGWSMKNPTIMEMADRSFDGMSTAFANDTAALGIEIMDIDEETTVDDIYNELAEYLGGMTMSIADKNTTAAGVTTIHFRGKDSDKTIDVIAIVKDDMAYTVTSIIENDSADMNDVLDIASSFSLTENEDMYDMSNVKDGTRSFEDDELKISMALPADFYEAEMSETNAHAFLTSGDQAGSVMIGVYSKSDTVTVDGSVAKDRERLASITDPTLAIVSEVEDTTIAGVPAKQYKVTYSGAGTAGKYVTRDIYFEIGDYVYNLTCDMPTEDEVNKVVDSFKAEELDPSVTGTILKDVALNAEKTVNIGSKTMTLAEDWLKLATGDITIVFNGYSDATLTVTELPGEASASMVRDYLEQISSTQYLEDMKEQNDELKSLSRVGDVKTSQIGGRTFYSVELKYEYKTRTVYDTVYMTVMDDTAYMMMFNRQDVYRDSGLQDQVEEMIASIK